MNNSRQSSPLRIAANRRNARKSTGPRTLAGKRRVALNALRRGLSSPDWERELRARREDVRDFYRLHRDLIAILRPQDEIARRMVEGLARTWWEKARRIRNWVSARPVETHDLDERVRRLLLSLVGLLRVRRHWWMDRLRSVLGQVGPPDQVRREIESRLFVFGAEPGRRTYPGRPRGSEGSQHPQKAQGPERSYEEHRAVARCEQLLRGIPGFEREKSEPTQAG